MCGGFWMISYSIAIYKGIKEKSYAMPFFSLCLNISWEMLYFKKVINGGDGGLIWIIIDSIWLILCWNFNYIFLIWKKILSR